MFYMYFAHSQIFTKSKQKKYKLIFVVMKIFVNCCS